MTETVAALVSGGLDSAVMLAELARRGARVVPVYVRCSLVWEEKEVEYLRRFLEAFSARRVAPLLEISSPMQDLFSEHWCANGRGIPGYREADERWEIPGRNLVLLAKTAVWCRLNGVHRMAHGTLSTNPFPDGTPEFFELAQELLSRGLNHPIRLLRPLAGMSKAEVVLRGRELPLALTLSCARPVEDLHCGECGKCRERVEAFRGAGVEDPTRYRRCPPSQ